MDAAADPLAASLATANKHKSVLRPVPVAHPISGVRKRLPVTQTPRHASGQDAYSDRCDWGEERFQLAAV